MENILLFNQVVMYINPKIIEAGWLAYRATVVPLEVPPVQLEETRIAFFAGAQHLFGSIMTILTEDRDPTPADLKRMDLINRELDRFVTEFKKKHGIMPTTH